MTVLGEEARPQVPVPPELFLCPSFVNLCSEPFSEIFSFPVVNTVAPLEMGNVGS